MKNLNFKPNKMYGKPQIKVEFKRSKDSDGIEGTTCVTRCLSAEKDESEEIED